MHVRSTHTTALALLLLLSLARQDKRPTFEAIHARLEEIITAHKRRQSMAVAAASSGLSNMGVGRSPAPAAAGGMRR